jgi:flagellar secretion chaperone FliS
LRTNPRGAAAYQQVAAQSGSPLDLVLMLYDGALRFMGEARLAIERNDKGATGHAVSRTLAIVSELQNTLNLQEGGAIAGELDRLYTYVNTRLLEVTAKRDLAALQDAQNVITTLRDGWAQVAQKTT